jgi:uncharacterized protein (TIRG00374 family)
VLKKSYKILIGLIISIAITIYLLFKIDFKLVIDEIKNFNIYLVLLLLVIFLIGMLLRTFRWKKIINQKHSITFSMAFHALAIGYMLNNLLPAKMGELARAEYLKRKKVADRSFTLGTIFIERFLDVLVVFLFLLFSVIFSETSRNIINQNKWLVIIAFSSLVLAFYLLRNPKLIVFFINKLPAKISSVFLRVMNSFASAFGFIENRKALGSIIALTLAIWFLTLATMFIIINGLNITIPYYSYFFIIAAGVFGMVIPSTSGGIGVFHAVATGALLLFGVSPEKALAYAVISHAVDFFPNILLGGGISFFQFSKKF